MLPGSIVLQALLNTSNVHGAMCVSLEWGSNLHVAYEFTGLGRCRCTVVPTVLPLEGTPTAVYKLPSYDSELICLTRPFLMCKFRSSWLK